jgi:hypothetical protein
MKPEKNSQVLPGISVLLAILISIVSLAGMLVSGFYAKESFNWQIQALGQDEIDLFVITPVLLMTGLNFSKNNRAINLLWAGTLLYVIYTFVLYCFDVHFNNLFPLYCTILGIAFYSFVWFIYGQVKNPGKAWNKELRFRRMTGGYLIALSVVFYLLWYSEIIQAIIQGTVPPAVAKSGLPTNPVHVLDISVILPAMFITGLFTLKGRPLAFVFANMLLGFSILMDVTIAWLSIKMNQAAITSGPWLTVAMAVLTTISLALFYFNTRETITRKPPGGQAEKHRLHPGAPHHQ